MRTTLYNPYSCTNYSKYLAHKWLAFFVGWFTYWRNERLVSRFDLFFILVDDCNEVTDYAIARRIIDLHTKLEESVERLYSEDEVC